MGHKDPRTHLLEKLEKRFSYKAIPCRPWRAGFFL